MPVTHFTEIVVSRLKNPGTYFDKTTPAFGMRVGKNRKTWFVVRGRERLQTRIGHYPDLSLSNARKQALVLIGSPLSRPVEVHKFSDALQQFYEVHVPRLKPKTQYQIKRVLDRHIAPPLNHKRLHEIVHSDITKVTDALAKTAPSEAWHCFKDARTFFKWCVPRYVKHSPMEGLKSPTKYVPRKRVLTDAELIKVWNAANEVGYPFGTAIQLSLLWGTRWGETISCKPHKHSAGLALRYGAQAWRASLRRLARRHLGRHRILPPTNPRPTACCDRHRRQKTGALW